jgi:ubiquinone/menaquinone biosynthesis C-methylase UbiE
MKADPKYDQYLQQWSALYEKNNYDEGLAGYFLTKSHEWSEKVFSDKDYFANVLEVGAGTGIHVKSVQHRFDTYVISDLNEVFLDKVDLPEDLKNRVKTAKENATSLSFDDDSFDRVIAAHVLEHLYQPHVILREWERVLKPGGLLSLILPCDPGIAWRLGRHLFARRKFIRAGMEYDYWMAREHVNPLNNLVSFVRYYFDDIHEQWLPLRIPSLDLNLFYIAHIRV